MIFSFFVLFCFSITVNAYPGKQQSFLIFSSNSPHDDLDIRCDKHKMMEI